MNLLIRTLFALFTVAVVMVLISLFLKDNYKVTRSLEIHTTPNQAFSLVSDFNQWKKWSPWYPKDTQAVYTITGNMMEKGYQMKWASENEKVGKGSLTLINAIPDQQINYALAFEGFDMTSFSKFEFKPTSQGVLVTWSDSGHLGWNPVSKWFGLFMDKMMGPDFEEGLRNMDKVQRKTE